MICSCPKCQAQIDVDLSKVPEKGAFMPCPECKGRFWIAREAYARMALNKTGSIYCDQCGKELDHKIICSACGVMFPDYLLVQASKPPRRQVEKVNIFTMGFSLKPAARPSYTYEYGYESAKKSAGWSFGFNMKMVAAVAALLVIAVSLNFFYKIQKEEQQYVKDYMRALYAIKTGNDLSLDICAKISADWKSKGQNVVPQISVDDEARLNKVKGVSDRYMQKLNKPPKKFISNKEKLENLYEIYARTNTLALAPSGSISTFESAAAKSQNEFNTSIAALKDGMPTALSEEFQIAQKKYKGLQNI